MSAIAGIFQLDGSPVDPAQVKQLSDRLSELGRDDHAAWCDGPVALMHSTTRLAPETNPAERPWANDSCVIVGDTRLDNRDDLARQLGFAAPESRGLPDGAFIVAAYQKWGEASPARLLGDFAFALWDARQQRLFCARDHLGSHPLYYHRGSTGFAFATTARHLLGLPGVSRKLNERRIGEYLLALPSNPESTYYQAVACLPAGHTISITRNEAKVSRYWSLEEIPEVRLGRDDDYAERLRELLDAAVACRLRPDHPAGSFLSGGLDSSTVAVTAAQQLKRRNQRLATYTSIPRSGYSGKRRAGKFDNERPFIEEIVRHAGNLDPNYVTTEGCSPLHGLEHDFYFAGPPLNLYNYTWQRIIGELARRQGVRVLLAGDAGNFALSRAGSSLPNRIDPGFAAGIRNLSSRWCGSSRRAITGHLEDLLCAVATRLPGRCRSWGWNPGWLGLAALRPEFVQAHALDAQLRRQVLNQYPDPRPAHRQTVLRTIALELGNSYRDRAAVWQTRHQISLSDPTRDQRIVEFCLGVPEDQYARDGQTRLLLRRAMSGRLPDSVVWNRSLGRQAADWMDSFTAARNEMAEELMQLRTSDTAARLLDLERMQRLFDQWPSLDHRSSRGERLYRHLFTRGLIAGKFIRWHERTGSI